ncbi:MAG: hypothetical protein ACKVS8_00730 [Phycisphaerales bacterium]
MMTNNDPSTHGDGEGQVPPSRPVNYWDAKREKAILALLNEPTIARAAESAGVGQRTLYAWMKQPAFMRDYRFARREMFSHAISLTQRYAPMAVNTLAKIMGDATATHAARVSASAAILKFSRDSIELDELAQRLDALEEQLGRTRSTALVVDAEDDGLGDDAPPPPPDEPEPHEPAAEPKAKEDEPCG